MGPDSTNFFCGLMQLSNCTRAEKASERLESMRGTSARLDRQVFAAGKKNKKETTPVKVSSHHTGDVTLSTGHTLYELLCAVPEGVLATL